MRLLMLVLLLWTTAVFSQGLENLAGVSGSVTAPAPFQAAKVYLRNTDRRMQYMVYTARGKYSAPYLLPGNYEVRVEARGLASPVQKISLREREKRSIDISLAPSQAEGEVVTMAEMFPPGPGQEYVRNTCVGCHNPNMFGAKQMPAAAWNQYVQMMLDIGQIPRGFSSPQEREDLVSYLGKNFGPDSKKRVVRFAKETPLDESRLAKAMYVEYYLPPNGKDVDSSLRRRGQDPHFDRDGNVWVTDRNVPNRLSRLNPRTGEWQDWPMPHPLGETHGLTIDRDGIVWVPERTGKRTDKDGPHLAAFDPKTEKWELFPLDPDGAVKEPLQAHTPVVDGQGNVWVTVIRGDRFYKWDRKTRKVTMHVTPTRPSAPYGIDIDSQGNIWMALFRGEARVGKYDPVADKFTEYKALTQPGRIRRASVDLQDRVWYGVYDKGVVGWIDAKSGKTREAKVPTDLSRPYDPQGDYEGNVWFGDDGQNGATVRFNPQSGEFTFYPTPQMTDQPKIELTREGAIWYCPRSAAEPGVGVLYPDTSKMKTLAAYYLDADPIASRKVLRTQRQALAR